MREFNRASRKPTSGRLARSGAVVAAVLLLPATLVACKTAGGASGGGGATVTGNISVSQPAGTPIAEVAQDFANDVKSATDGRVVLKVFPHDQLGSGTSIVQGCEQGTIAFCQEQALSSVVPSIQAPQAPYLFTSIDNASQVLNRADLTAVWKPEFKAKGLTYFGQWALPPSSIGSVPRPINKSTDLKGLRLRVPNAYLGGLMFKPIGADPVLISSSQVGTSLSTHAIDGIDDPLPTLLTEGWIDQLKYVTISNDWYGADVLVASNKFMSKLSPADQASVQRAFTNSLAQNNQLENSQLSQALTQVKSKGVQVITPSSLDTFQQGFSSVNAALVKAYPDVMPLVLKAIGKTS